MEYCFLKKKDFKKVEKAIDGKKYEKSSKRVDFVEICPSFVV